MFKIRITSTVLSNILAGFLLLLFSTSTLAANLKIDNSFNPEVLDKGLVIKTVAEQADGKLLIGGTFLRANGAGRTSLARLNADGTLDTTFNPVLGGAIRTVFSIIVQSDGKILVAGGFISINGAAQSCVARLNADGSLDAGFISPFGLNNLIEAMTLAPDGKIIVAGFLFYNLGGSPRRDVARLNPDGSFDTTFDIGQQGADSLVNALAVQPDGKVLVGGYFTSFAGTARRGIARLNNNGSLDSTFNPGTGANNNVETIAVQPDGKIIIGGNFTDYNGSPRLRLARINADGSLDASFNTSNTTDGTVAKIILLPDGKLLVGGSFQTVNGTPRRRFARLNANGTVDSTFNPPAPDTPSVNAIVVQADGRIVLGGNFAFLSRISSSGSIDTAFNPLVEQQGVITAIAVQPNGKILVGGQFTRINGVARRNIARLNADGSVDTAFQASVSALVSAIAVQPDGRIIIGGYFTAVNNISRNYIARLSADGAFVDANFLPAGANNVVLKIALQPNGQILVGGYFGTMGGVERRRLARVNADGTLDQSFTAGTGAEDSAVSAITVQPDGKILVGGSFAMFGGSPRSSLARLLPDGSLDLSFNAGTNNSVARIVSQPDGRILIGGSFSSVNGTARQGIARLTAGGGLDSSYNTIFNIFSTIDDLLAEPDGRILVAGN
ncbi:MAG TPA: delta-60 repeat domain-containing protein, partial [Pyrinomonadaceae bacterium]|nr:delta-60 repeat domain-containing protein [Pyrinomonadaceae bacterium]